MSKLTDKNALPDDQAVDGLLFHVVDPNDNTDDVAGSSFFAELFQFAWGAKIQGFADISLAGAAYTGDMQNDAINGYIDGAIYIVKPDAESVNASTIDLNSIGAKPIRKGGNTAASNLLCTLGDMVAGRWYVLIYHSAIDGGGFYLMNPEYPNMIVAEYNFASDGGAVSTINLTGAIVPIRTLVDLEGCYIDRLTNFTSAGTNSMISIGFGAGAPIDVILSDIPINFDSFSQGGIMGRNMLVGSVELTGGGAGSVDSITVATVDILHSASVAFNGTLAQTAIDVAKDINENPLNTILAVAQGVFIYLYRPDPYQFKRTSTQASLTVGSTSTTITTANTPLGNKGGANPARFYKVSAAVPVSFTIKNDALTVGKLRVYIPILPNVQN